VTDPVKPARRRYDSPRRRLQAERTRRDILDAAQRLFEGQGYATTTMAAIASEAGVALKTVYVAFETKAGVLRALWHLLLRGDQDDVPVANRSWYREVLEEPDPERLLRGVAHYSRQVKERVGAILAVIRSAADADPDVDVLWRRIQSEFYDTMRPLVEAVEAHGGLAPGLDVTRGTDILWTLNHPDLWHLLVGQRGWSPDEFEAWFADTLCAQLLPPATRPG
jgi:AcrR family transcriptional regulator